MRNAGFRLIKDIRKSVEFLSVDVAIELTAEKKFKLQSIHFAARNSTNSSVILIVKINIVTIFGRKKNTGDKKTVNGSGIDEHGTLISDNSIKVNESNDEALHSAWSIRYNPFDILADGNTGCPWGMEPCALGRSISTLMTHEFLKSSGKGRNEHLDGGIRKSLHLHLWGRFWGVKKKKHERKKRRKRTNKERTKNEQLGSRTEIGRAHV